MKFLKTALLLILFCAAALQLRGEAFNVFNIQNWDVPSSLTINTNATSIAVGAGRVTALAQGTTPRQLQFGVRFVF